MVQFCHRAIFALIVFVLVYSVVMYGATQEWVHGATQEWVQGPLVAAVILAVLFWAIRIAVVPEVEVVFSALGTPLFLAGLYLILRYALADIEPVSRPSMLLAISALLFFFVLLNDFSHRWQITAIVWIITILGVLLAVYGCVQVLCHQAYACGTFLKPMDLAVFLQMAFAVATANFFLSHRSQSEKLGLAFAGIAICIGLLVTFSIWHWLGWSAALIVVALFTAFKRTWHFRWVVAGACVLVAVTGAVIFGAMSIRNQNIADGSEGPILQAKLSAVAGSQPVPESASNAELTQRGLWDAALTIGQNNFWVGGGGGMFPWLFPRHRTVQGVPERCPNLYLQVFAEYGGLGVILFIWIGVGLALAMLSIIRLRDKKYSSERLSNRYAFVVTGLAILAAVAINAGVDLNLQVGGLLFPLLAIMATTLTCGVHRRVNEDDQREQPGHHLTIRLFGVSRFVLVAGLVGLALFLTAGARRTYPAKFFLHRGRQQLARLDWAGAEQTFQRARWFDGRSYKVAEALGDLYIARATWDLQHRAAFGQKAYEWYNRALTLNYYAADIQVKIGRLQDVLGNSTKAQAAYRQALDIDPLNASYHVALGQSYARAGDEDEAQHQFRLAHNLGATEILPALEIPSPN